MARILQQALEPAPTPRFPDIFLQQKDIPEHATRAQRGISGRKSTLLEIFRLELQMGLNFAVEPVVSASPSEPLHHRRHSTLNAMVLKIAAAYHCGIVEHHPIQDVKIEILAGNRADVRIIKLSGALTIHNFFEFQDLSRQKLPGILIVDLTGVAYIDSAALGCLIGIHLSREKSGQKYAFVGANERAKSLFQMCGVDQLFVSYSSIGEAEAALA
jgi:anti-anti-sigma factor